MEEVPAGALRLTFSQGDDRSPAWSASGDSILYVAEGFGDLARSSGVIVSIPRGGGDIQTALPVVQPERSTSPALLAPAVEPGSGRIAYAQVLFVPGVCITETTSCDAADTIPAAPTLQLGRLRVRTPGSVTPADQDPTLPLAWEGVTFDDSQRPFGLPGVWVTHLYPFQERYNATGLLPSRASWEPGGARLVTSDGLRLLLWIPGEAEASPVPGTDLGTSPAWSPDGSAIAYAATVLGPQQRTSCQHLAAGSTGLIVVCVEDRTQWGPGRSVIRVISPTGGEPVELVEGVDPAWGPDGDWIYYGRDDGIWRVRPGGGVFERVPDTEGGSEPAVSPDGRSLAFTRRGEDGKGDIWVVPLP